MKTIQERARAARRLLEDEAVKSVCDAIQADAVAAFLSSRGDPVKMAEAFHRAQSANHFLGQLKSWDTNGKVEDKKSEQKP